MTREERRRRATDAGVRTAVARAAVPSEVLLGYRLWQVHYCWHRYIEQYLKALDLTHLQYVLLVTTYHLTSIGEAPSQIRLSNFTNVEKMMVSKNLRTLEQRGYMSRRPDPDDRRANRIQLTVAGTRILRRAFDASARAHQSFFSVLGKDWKQINNQLRLLIHDHRG